MTTRRSADKRRKAAGSGILLRYRDNDSAYGVSRGTAIKLAETLGVSETQVIHVALAHLARQTLPRYEVDDGPLADERYREIGKLVPQDAFKGGRKRLY
jgi:hypothetical protein